MKIIREKDYQIGWACFLDDKNKVLLDFTKCMDQPNIMLSDIQSLCDNATILKAKNNAYFIGDYKYLSKAETEKYLKELFLEFENGVIKDRTYCCLNHYGKYANIAKTYQKLLEAIKLNDYQIVGVPTERYLSGRWDKENENEYVTQIMIPVKIN